jgi:hypothetical protein
MARTMDRPTIFLSSTIYDFRDMRSAIKEHLERNGCRVLASEFNDFTKPLDKHSYAACLAAIEQADFFLLLIGTRVGGWYDEAKRVSITQQEYRTAYGLAKADRLRLLSFVRAEVWNHRQSAKELEKHLKFLAEVDDALRDKIISYPTTFASDVKFLVSFIDEVSKNKETADAVRGKGAMPVANWLHSFTGFGDIRDVVDPLILRGLSVRDAAGRRALQNQLLILLRDVLPLIRGKPLIPSPTIQRLAQEINLKIADVGTSATITGKNWNTFMSLALLATRSNITEFPFASFLGSDLLLEYDSRGGVFRQTNAYDLLTELVDQLRKLEQAKASADFATLAKFGANRRNGKPVSAPVHLIAMHLQLLFRWADVGNLARALALALEGKPFDAGARMPLTPFLDDEKVITEEQVSLEQVRQFVGLEGLTHVPPTVPKVIK